MVRVSNNSKNNIIKIDNSKAAYYADKARIYKEQTGTIAETVENIYNQIETESAGIQNIYQHALALIDTIDENVSVTSANIDNINKIANNLDSLMSNFSSMNTVSANISDVNTVANNISDVSTVADNISIIDNLSAEIDRIDQSKGKKTGNVSTNENILTDIKSYAHSTFDASKFTVVGSPIITSDGIMTSASNNNYLVTSAISGSTIGKNDFEFVYEFIKQGSTAPSGNLMPFGGGNNVNNGVFQIYIDVSQVVANVAVFYDNSGSSAKLEKAIALGGWTEGSTYKIVAKRENNIFYVTSYKDGTLIDSASATLTQSLFGSTSQQISRSPIYNLFIDLKSIKLTVDGVPVFSGNKTGVDTIKPDDYTIVGSPTISDDGIASEFSASNYLSTGLASRNVVNSEIYLPFKTGTLGSSSQFIYTAVNGFTFQFCYNGAEIVTWFGDGSSWLYQINDWLTPVQNTEYLVKIETSANKIKIYVNGILTKDYDTTNFSYDLASIAHIGTRTYATANPFEGSIDLNAFKVYVDGNLVYQPCLKIPYTESKTGSKIVSSPYRARVNDMAEQFGFAPYYTLSDSDFTLPQVELYGLIGAKTLRDSYRNGINYWELYSNRDLEQGGSCTSGVEVTLAKPFSDTNYVLSVPYSAKSATAFTPTVTGDWIAKGKGIL